MKTIDGNLITYSDCEIVFRNGKTYTCVIAKARYVIHGNRYVAEISGKNEKDAYRRLLINYEENVRAVEKALRMFRHCQDHK